MLRKKETITLSIPPGSKEKLESIATKLNILWGDRGSISGLLAAIANESVDVGLRIALNSTEIDALEQATRIAIDTGHVAQAHTILGILFKSDSLQDPQRRSLQQLA